MNKVTYNFTLHWIQCRAQFITKDSNSFEIVKAGIRENYTFRGNLCEAMESLQGIRCFRPSHILNFFACESTVKRNE